MVCKTNYRNINDGHLNIKDSSLLSWQTTRFTNNNYNCKWRVL